MRIRMSECKVFSLTVIFKCKRSSSGHFISPLRAFCSPRSGAGVRNSFSLLKGVFGGGRETTVALAIIRAFVLLVYLFRIVTKAVNFHSSQFSDEILKPLEHAKPMTFLHLRLLLPSLRTSLPWVSSPLAFHVLSIVSSFLHSQGLCTGSFPKILFLTYSQYFLSLEIIVAIPFPEARIPVSKLIETHLCTPCPVYHSI